MPKVSLGSLGHVIKAVVTFVPIIYSTDDWMSWSVSLFICPFWTMFLVLCTLTFPDLKWLTANTVQDGQESRLICILEHVYETYNNTVWQTVPLLLTNSSHILLIYNI